jgi:DNA repair protein RecN (Recombination protein N)
VVERLRVHFIRVSADRETGSGKSVWWMRGLLLVDGRQRNDSHQGGAARSRGSGVQDQARRAPSALETAGWKPGQGTADRARDLEGKSRAFVGSRPVAVSLLKDLAPLLGDIHGQHDQQLLFSSEAQRDMLDAFAENRELLDSAARLYQEWRAAAAELEELERNEQEKLRLLDLWSFQRKEIESAALSPDEDTQLENERRVLQNVQKLQESAGTAYDAVYESPESAVALARIASKRVEDLYRIDATLDGLREHLKSAELSLQEAAYALRDYLSGLEANPGRLEEVETRLETIARLKRKYGQSMAEILAFLEEVRGQIAGVESAGARIEALRKEQKRLAGEFEKLARGLTEARKSAARRLEKRVEAELAQLAMERTVFRVAMTEAAWPPAGADRVEFLVSPNVGEEPRPLEKVASGGEISRLALALKTCLAGPKTSVVRTLVFDEVDTGVGGSAAEGVGRRLKKLAAANQVLCVTHLPQIASFADHHYRVEKQESRGRTVAVIEELDAAARTREVGRMLSGQKLTPEAIKNAERLIKMSVG